MTEQHDINIDLKYDPARQYYLRIPTSEFEETVPDILINVVRKKNTIECQTLPLMKMNQKIRDAHNEVISMSDNSVQELINAVRSKIHPLFKISESLAMLDMLAGMAQLVTTQDYVKPDLTSSTLALRSSRHPILDKIFPSRCTTTKLIPNDVYSTPQHRFQIITGANMSGKSTYIRSIALNALLAQTGCFVPAQYASFPIFHQLFALLATDSNVEANVSSFASEMSAVAFIVRNIEPRSLVIVDELGRGTSTTDGLAIAIAIAEALISSNAYVWFVTHFHDLPRILGERAGVVNLHLNVDITPSPCDPRRRRTRSTTDDDSNAADPEQALPTKMKMTYRIAPGPLPASSQYYGLTLARTISLPPDVIDVASQVSQALHTRNQARKSNPQAMAVARRRKLVLGLREQLRQCRENWNQDGNDDGTGLREWLKNLQQEFIVRLGVIQDEAEVDVTIDVDGYGRGESMDTEEDAGGEMVTDAEGAEPAAVSVPDLDAEDNKQQQQDDTLNPVHVNEDDMLLDDTLVTLKQDHLILHNDVLHPMKHETPPSPPTKTAMNANTNSGASAPTRIKQEPTEQRPTFTDPHLPAAHDRNRARDTSLGPSVSGSTTARSDILEGAVEEWDTARVRNEREFQEEMRERREREREKETQMRKEIDTQIQAKGRRVARR